VKSKGGLLVIFLAFVCFSIWPVPKAEGQLSIPINLDIELELSSNATFWEDQSNQSSITDAIAHFQSGEFRNMDCPDKNFGFSNSTHWLRIPIEFKGTQATKFILEAGRPTTNLMTLWQRDKTGRWTFTTVGDALPQNPNSHYFKPNLFELTLYPNHDNTLYLRFESEGDIAMLSASLFTPEEFHQHDQYEQVFLGIFFGIMVFAILSNLFLFSALRESSYLWYVLYVLSIVLLQVSLEGYASTVFFRFSSFFADRSIIFLTSATIFFVLLYSKKFLNLCTLVNRWPSRWIDFTMSISIMAATFSLWNGYFYKISLILVNLSGMLSILGIVYCLYAGRKENRPSNPYFYAAFASLFLGTIVFILANSNILPLSFINYNSLKFGNTLEVILLSLSMAEQFSMVQKEKEKAQKEAFEKLQEINLMTDQINVRLEIEVAQRTQQLNKQNLDLEQKNKDITDSILYAATLQQSVMPELTAIKSVLPDAFVLNLPKDIVSGDFYWFGTHSERIYFAVADCTGHGVPGAFMSILGVDIFDRLIKGKTPPAIDWMLEQLDHHLSHVFKENANLDMHEHGMDVALVCYDPIAKTLEFCGAGRPLYIRTQDGELQRIPGNKRSIGSKRMRDQAFEKETIFLKQSAWVYLQSDGFTDQFGGLENKKIHRKTYESFLSELGHTSGDQQHLAFRNFLSAWKKDQEQVDDILVMGVKVE